MFQKIGIIGLGLIGGSLAKACKARCGISEIVAYNRNPDVLKLAYQENVITEYTTKIDAHFEHCDLIFICTPVDQIFHYAEKLVPFLKPNCIITDVGSTKGTLYQKIKTLSPPLPYIGGHPMTGAEKFRYPASKEHLFENAYYILTPSETVSEKKVEELKILISSIGAIPIIISPSEHDHIVASISHVPHILAAGLVNMVKKLDSEQGYMHLLAAGGFKDITRIASSSPEMWKSICFENKKEILEVLSSLEFLLHQMKKTLIEGKEEQVYRFFEEARLYRDSFSSVSPGLVARRYEIDVDVLDKPGSIAIIAVLFSSNNINIKNMEIVNNRERDNGVLLISFETEEERQKSVALLKEMNYEVYIKK